MDCIIIYNIMGMIIRAIKMMINLFLPFILVFVIYRNPNIWVFGFLCEKIEPSSFNPYYSWKNMNNDDNLLKTSVIQ